MCSVVLRRDAIARTLVPLGLQRERADGKRRVGEVGRRVVCFQ